MRRLSILHGHVLQHARSMATHGHGIGIEGATALRLQIPGLEIAALALGDPSSPKRVLALHGWIDNAASHSFTAPALAARGYYVVCPDFPGHGHSSHRSPADVYSAGSHALAAGDVVNALGWERFGICGHSMGAGIGGMLAGSLRDRVTWLALIDGVGLPTSVST